MPTITIEISQTKPKEVNKLIERFVVDLKSLGIQVMEYTKLGEEK